LESTGNFLLKKASLLKDANLKIYCKKMFLKKRLHEKWKKVEKTVAENLFSKNVCSLRGCKKMVNLTKIYSKLVAEKFSKKKKTA
jgi:hypothetical protein